MWLLDGECTRRSVYAKQGCSGGMHPVGSFTLGAPQATGPHSTHSLPAIPAQPACDP